MDECNELVVYKRESQNCKLKLSKYVLGNRKLNASSVKGSAAVARVIAKTYYFANGKESEKVGRKDGCHVGALMSFVGEAPQLAETSTDETS